MDKKEFQPLLSAKENPFQKKHSQFSLVVSIYCLRIQQALKWKELITSSFFQVTLSSPKWSHFFPQKRSLKKHPILGHWQELVKELYRIHTPNPPYDPWLDSDTKPCT